jgi:hypothetical protein
MLISNIARCRGKYTRLVSPCQAESRA